MAQLRVGPIIAPSGNAGVRWSPMPWLRFGLSGQLPFWVSAPAQLGVRLPSSPFYSGAEVHGDRADVSFTLAPVIRVGVEVRPTRIDRIELTGVWEGWSVHDRISLTPTRDGSQPNGIQITNVRGVGTYDVGPTFIERGFQDSWSIRLGYERDQDLGRNWHLFPRLGIQYETSATSPAYTTVLTQDSNKVTFSAGASVSNGRVRLDALVAYVATPDVAVDPRDGRIFQVAPFRANNPPTYAINAGVYSMSALVLGLGLRYGF
jgi:long-chain fatty acid transport protein